MLEALLHKCKHLPFVIESGQLGTLFWLPVGMLALDPARLSSYQSAFNMLLEYKGRGNNFPYELIASSSTSSIPNPVLLFVGCPNMTSYDFLSLALIYS